VITHAADLIEFASDAAFAVDIDSEIVAWNAPAERLLGYSPDEVMGRFCGEILQATLPGGEPLCHPECDVFQCFTKCQPYGVPSCRVRRKDGEWIQVSIATVAMSERARRLYASNIMAVVFVRQEAIKNILPEPHTLQIFTLGSFGLAVAGRRVATEKWKRKQAVTLLKYLVTQLDRPFHRERLLDCLWPDVDETQSWGRLKVTMYYLRHELRANGISDDVVKTSGNAYLLRRDAVWLDAYAFEQLVIEGSELQQQGQWSDALGRYDEARYLYRGDYLEEEIFSDWCAEERERLREIYLEMLARTVECHTELAQYSKAVHICRKALVFDPCRESFHCLLMENLVNYGQPDMALTQFHRCQQILADEFGAEPLPETQRLYQQIRKELERAEVNKNGRG
jgi:PAS domain S-box-containing protein